MPHGAEVSVGGAVAGRAVPLAELCAQALVEEPAQEEERADREEGERAGQRAQVGEVVEKELGEGDAEESEAGESQAAPGPDETERQNSEAHEAPEDADRRVAALEVGPDA